MTKRRSDRRARSITFIATLFTVLFSMVVVGTNPSLATAREVDAPKKDKPKTHKQSAQPVMPEREKQAGEAPHERPTNVSKVALSANAGANADDPIDMKALVLCADGNETDYPALQAFLNQVGMPFETLLAKNTPLTRDRLWDGGVHGYYQAIFLCTGDLSYYDASTNSWPSALDATEWATLWDYEARFGVRQVTSFTVPGGGPENYGMGYGGHQNTLGNPLSATLTTAGRGIFNYLNVANPITISGAWTYFGLPAIGCTSDPGCVVTPLLMSGTNILAATTRYSDGRENLSVTAANNPNLMHSMLLSYGLINWATKGLFIGQRHVYFDAQVDDLFYANDLWDPVTQTDTTGLSYRLTAADMQATLNWQRSIAARYGTTATLRLEHAFNGEGGSGSYSPDDLTPWVRANQAQFNWVNHTWDHAELDNPCEPNTACASTTAQIVSELQRNHDFAVKNLRLTRYSRDTMVQPNISGLYNSNFYAAARQFGIRNVISDTSRTMSGPCLVTPCTATWNNPSPNIGFRSNAQPTVLVIPRYPSNLFYNLSTPVEWVSEYNCYYGPTGTCAGGAFRFWDRDLTYQEILDKESEFMLSYLLKWSLNPLMFHQANLRAYNSTNSLLSDLIDATMVKYNRVYNLPIVNLRQKEVGTRMADWMAFKASGVTGSLVPCIGTAPANFTITAPRAATIPLTGVAFGTQREVYGGQNISYVSLTAGQSITIPLATCP